MNNFDVAKWNKQRYLAEANLLESKAQEAATAIDKILDEIDPSGITPEELGEAIAIIVKKGYQAELQEKFMDALHKKLGYSKDLNEAKELSSYKIGDKVEFPNGEVWKVTKPGVKYDKVFLAPFNDIAKKGHISVAIEFTADELKDAVLESLNENFAKFDTLKMAINQHEKGAPYFDKTVLIKIFNELSSDDQVRAKKQYSGYFVESVSESKKFSNAFAVLDFFGGALPNDYSKALTAARKAGYDLPTSLYYEAAELAQDGVNESVNEAKDEFYPDSPEALRQATQTAKEILKKNRDSIKIIADKYKGKRAKSREMMDELDALIDADLEGIAFQEYISDKVKGVLGKALFRYYASQNPELSKIMR